MSTTQPLAFNCPECGRKLGWNSRIAGMRVSCPCGKRFNAPINPPAPETYDVSASDLEELPPVTKPARKLSYESKAVDKAGGGASWGEFDYTSLIIPAAIVIVGAGLRFCLPLFLTGAGNQKVGATFGVILLGLMMSVITMLIGVGLVAKMTGADLGSVPVTISRLCAIAVIGSILFAVMASLDKGDGMRGMVIAWHCVLLLNWVMFATMFEFDTQESLFACAVVGVLQAIAACAVFRPL